MDLIDVLIPILMGAWGIYKIYSKYAQSQKQNKIFEKAAGIYGCTFVKGNLLALPKFYGTCRGINIRVELYKENKKEHMEISMKYQPLQKGKFLLEKETVFSKMKKTLGFDDIIIGDPIFDKTMLIRASSSALAAALLSKKQRELITRAEKDSTSFMVGKEGLKASYPGESGLAGEVTYRVDLLLAIGESILKTSDIEESLIQNLASETSAGVLTNIIRSLGTDFIGSKKTKKALSKALEEEPVPFQIEAARYLGAEGMKHLCDLLKKSKPLKESLMIKSIEILGREKYKTSLTLLKKVCGETESQGVKKAIIKAFQGFEDSNSETFLLKQLNQKNTELRDSAIEALGACGTVVAAEQLYKLASETMNPFTRGIAQKALTEIQSRLGDVKKGWLSVSESPEKEGALSVSNDSAEGALSLEKKE